MSERKVVSRNVVVALELICVVLVASLVGGFGFFLLAVNDKDSTISSLNSQISQLSSNITSLQNQVSSQNSSINLLTSNLTELRNQVMIQQKVLNDLLNMTATVATVDEIAFSPNAWLGKTVIVEGKLSGPVVFIPESMPPYDYMLFRYNETSEASTVFVGLSWDSANSYYLTNALVIGVVRFVYGDVMFHKGGYFIEADIVILP